MSKNRSYWIVPAIMLLATPSNAADKREVKQAAFACVDRTVVFKIMDLQITDGDTEAARKLLARNMATKDCIQVEEGQQVYVETGDPEKAGFVCVRPVGDPSCYWTHSVTLRRP